MEKVDVPRLSASSLKTFKDCPGRFEFGKIKGVDGMDSENKYTIVGSMIHEAIENVLRDTEGAMELGENEIAHLLKSEFHSHPDRQRDEIGQKMVGRGMKCLQTAARYIAAQEGVSVRELEPRFETYIDDVKFSGYIDVTTEYEVWDWKSGNMPDDDDRLGEMLQGMVYKDGFKELYGQYPERVRFIYIKEGKERVYENDDDAYDQMISMTRDIKRAVDADEFPYRPGDACYWCEYELMCPASNIGVGGIRWEAF